MEKCKICGKMEIYAKGLCKKCYSKEYNKKYKPTEKYKKIHRKYQKKYYRNHKKYYKEYNKLYKKYHMNYFKEYIQKYIIRKYICIKWDICPICNMYGRFRIMGYKNIKTGYVWFDKLISINHNIKSKYHHTCYIPRDEIDFEEIKLEIIKKFKEKISGIK